MSTLGTKKTFAHVATIFIMSLAATTIGCGPKEATSGLDRSKAYVSSTSGGSCGGTSLNLDDPNVKDLQFGNVNGRLTMSWNGDSEKNFVVFRCKQNTACNNYTCSFHLVFQCVGNPSCIVSDEAGVNRTSSVTIDEVYDVTRFLELSDAPLASGESVLVQSY